MKGNVQTINESIRIEAYLLSEKAGHPGGMEHYFWTQAEAIVHARAMAVSVAVEAAAIKTKAKRPAKVNTAATTKPVAKPKPEAKAAKEVKGKTAAKPAVNGANGKAHQLSLNGEMAAPTPKRAARK